MITVDRDSPEPMYLQIAGQLRDQILSGELAGRVRSVKSYSQEAGVSKVVLEMAMAVLKEEGLIETAIGKGAYTVRRQPPPE